MPLVEEVAFLGDVAAVAEVVEILAVVAEVISLTRLRTSFHRVSFVEELIMQCSSATSVLIHIIWAKIEVPMLQPYMEYIQIGTQISVQHVMSLGNLASWP
jgi:hypothetical protein